MTFVDDLADLMPSTIYIASYVSSDAYGKALHGTPVAARARVTHKPTAIRNWAGEQVIARGVVWAATADAFGPRDLLTLPDGSEPPVLAADRPEDENGDRHLKVYFG